LWRAHFRQIGEIYPADLAAIPIAAYGVPAERWFHQPNHMDTTEAVQCHCDLHSRQSVAVGKSERLALRTLTWRNGHSRGKTATRHDRECHVSERAAVPSMVKRRAVTRFFLPELIR